MKINLKKIGIAILVLAIMVTNLISNYVVADAAASGIAISDVIDKNTLNMKPGETKHIVLPVKAIGAHINEVSSVEATAKEAPFYLSQAIVSARGEGVPIYYLPHFGTAYVEFDIEVKETAQIGNYPITITITELDGTDTFTHTLSVNAQVLKELPETQITISEVSVKEAIIGGNTDVTFQIKNEGGITARNAYISLDYGATNIVPKYVTPKIKLDDLAPGENEYMTLPVSILPTATVGLKTITVNIEYKDMDGTDGKDSHQIFVDVKKSDNSPEIMIDDIIYDGALEPGAEVVMTAVLRNFGVTKAEDINIKLSGAGMGFDGLIKGFYTESIWVGSLKSDTTMKAKIPVKVSKQAVSGIKTVDIIISYEDSEGREYSSTITAYPEIIGGGASGSSGILISNVKQSSSQPIAGEKIDISFNIQNKNKIDISGLRVTMPGLDGTTFIPVRTEPYLYIDKLAAGETKKITIPLIVSDSIMEGLNNLLLKFTYSDTSEEITIPISNVVNDLGSNSTPKLIVSKYTTDTEEIRAGSTFNYTFDIYNTNSSIAAKNITVTVTQEENVFTATQGSNSFFINKIEAGETVTNTLEMKVKSDASTKAYPLKIVLEYEYDGIKPNPETGEAGVTKPYTINLQAVENSRPVVDYVNVYSFDGNVTMGNVANLAFEFYNMGRSPLNNVIATVEGDFAKADGNMYFIGNVAEGSSTYAEFEVIPNMEGMAKGTLKITYEDSNGDEVEFIKEFESDILPAAVFDPGVVEGGEVFNPEMPIAKKAILPVWLFVLLQIIIFALFIPITRKIIINLYKSKLRKKELEQY